MQHQPAISMKHYIVGAVPSNDITTMPVAEVEIDATTERDAIEKAKETFRKQLTTLHGLRFLAVEVKD